MTWAGGVAVAMVAVLAGCVTPTPYVQATTGTGFSEQRLETGRYRVRFAGNARTSRETVETYLLFRAAEVTLAAGAGHFRIVQSDTAQQVDYFGPDYGPGYGFHGLYGHRHSGFGVSISQGYGRAITSYEAVATIVVLPGPKPAGDTLAYDARDVIATLGPTIRYPEPG